MSPEPLTDAERQRIELVRSLADDERDGLHTLISLGPFTMYTMVGLLQLILRNPGIADSPFLLEFTRRMCDQFSEPFRGTPLWDDLQKGYDETYDVPIERIGG